MSKDRLELIDDLTDILYADKVEIREFVRKSLDKDDTVDSMAHIIKLKNKEMRELSNFLKERNIPLKELSPLITVMNRVQELENKVKTLEEQNNELTGVGGMWMSARNKLEFSRQQNKRYREALEFYSDKETYVEKMHQPRYFDGVPTEPPYGEPPLIYYDNYGDTARKALEEYRE